ncbi:unnamed protein product, partial [Ixodes pacificus]
RHCTGLSHGTQDIRSRRTRLSGERLQHLSERCGLVVLARTLEDALLQVTRPSGRGGTTDIIDNCGVGIRCLRCWGFWESGVCRGSSSGVTDCRPSGDRGCLLFDFCAVGGVMLVGVRPVLGGCVFWTGVISVGVINWSILSSVRTSVQLELC